MRIEKLNENKIRIFLNLEDLRKKNIDLHTFMSNSLETQDLFKDMLDKAEVEVGFNSRNHKLLIEALASSNGNFIFTITRVKPDSISNVGLPKPKLKKQIIKPNKALSIYCFNTFDDFCEFCNYIYSCNLKDCITKLKSSSLILFKNNYYLILNNIRLNVADIKSFSYVISEFASKSKNEILLERKLKEYGKIIFEKNAISICLHYFSNAKNKETS